MHGYLTLIVGCMFSGDEYASRFLIENGASVNIALPTSRLTPLHLAVLQSLDLQSTNHMSSIIELLLQKSADANACDSDCRSVLCRRQTYEKLATKTRTRNLHQIFYASFSYEKLASTDAGGLRPPRVSN